MVLPPQDKPLIDIPGIDEAKVIELRTRNRGTSLLFQLFVDNQPTRIDPDHTWADREWFGLVVRELDRRKIWHYSVVGNTFYYVRT